MDVLGRIKRWANEQSPNRQTPAGMVTARASQGVRVRRCVGHTAEGVPLYDAWEDRGTQVIGYTDVPQSVLDRWEERP